MALDDNELRDVLARAEEIQQATRHGKHWEAEVAAVIAAAQEVGLSRAAVERALAERLHLPPAPPPAGSQVWARSANGKFYVAEVLSSNDETVHVRFLRAGEHRVGPGDVRPCAFIPGERVVCDWPTWGPWTCSVVSYDGASQQVTLSDGWGYTKAIPVAEVWMAAERSGVPARRRLYTTLAAAGAAGATIGSIITALLLR